MNEAPKRKVGRPKGSRSADIILKAKKIQEIINLSEAQLIKVLKGQTKLSEKTVVNVALELYKRRVPTKVESDGKGDSLTLIKIVKNHVPEKLKQAEVIEEAVDGVLSKRKPEEIRRLMARSHDEGETWGEMGGDKT